ncbi:MAG: MMPL family transporter [bacterium]|nr:MMPL family transporter [bacterium]
MKQFMLWSHRHPAIVIVLLVITSCVFAAYIPRISTEVSTRDLWIKNDPAIAEYDDTLDLFGSDKMTLIYVKDADLFLPDTLALLQAFHDRIEDWPDVVRVDSLFSVSNFKGVDGVLYTDPLIEDLPDTVEAAQAIRQDALRNPMLIDQLISDDGQSTVFSIFLDEESDTPDYELLFSQQLDDEIAAIAPQVDEIFQIGNPYVNRMMFENMLRDQRIIYPLGALLFAIASLVIWRSAKLLGMTAITSGLSILWTVGFMGMFRIPLNTFTAMAPILLLVVGSTEDIHLFSEYLTGIGKTGDRGKAVTYMVGTSSTALFLTAVTTFLGFLAICLNQILAIKHFGAVAAFGLLVNPLITFMVAPVYLGFFGPKQTTVPANTRTHHIFMALAERLIAIIQRYRWRMFGIIAGVCVCIGLFATQIEMRNDTVGLFKPSSPVRTRSDRLHEEMAGTQVFFIHISSGWPDTFIQPENLHSIADFQQALEQQDWGARVYSIVDYVSLIHREMNDGDDAYHALPDSSAFIAQYLLLMSPDELERVITDDYSEINLIVRHNESSSLGLKQRITDVETLLGQYLNPHFEYRIVGESILTMRAADTIALGQVLSFSFTLVVIFLLMSILFVNVKAGLLALIPNVLPLLLIFGIMGAFGIALNFSTSMLAAIAIGIAVDDTIHFMTRYYHEMRRRQNQHAAMDASLREEVRPIIATSIGLALGFSVLMLSSMVPLTHFGLLAALAMLFALLADLCVTPILLSSTQLLTLWDMVDLHLRDEVITQSPLFANLRSWQIKKVVLLGKMEHKAQGETIIRQGEPGNSMYMLLEGQVHVIVGDVETNQQRLVADYGPGDVFGEIALVNPGPRTADILARHDVVYLEIDWDGMERLRRLYPRIASHLYRNLARILGERLKDTTHQLMR